ncbi:MAG TPA: M20/M25/M40 family metallo-hydrolase, partial [Abditibacteriaceae bacterium]
MNANHPYFELEPREVWRHFAALNEIARPSGYEAGARTYVQRVAQEAGATWKTDARGNIVVLVPPRGSDSAAHNDAPTVAILSHLDMVCEKRPNVEHDFFHDPIIPRHDGDLIYATGTTLGADNGIGAAMALAVLTSSEIAHGPLELLFTVEEETGLYGALELDAALLRASMLINLDSEDPEELTIGCAGGAGIQFLLDIPTEAAPENWPLLTLNVSGLKGGHSGVQIHEPLANAIKLLCAVLGKCVAAGI